MRRHAAVLDELESRQDPNWRRLRGERESLLGNWGEAARVLADSNRHTDVISLAALHGVREDAAAFQSTIDRLPQLLQEQVEGEALRHYWQAVSQGLWRNSDSENAEEMLRLANSAAEADPKNARYRFALGLAHFRGRNYKAALDPLQESLEILVHDVDDLTDHAMSCAVLAMACFHLDRPDEARDWLARCDQWRDQSTRRTITAFHGNHRAGRGLGDHRWNVANALTREAKLLINGADAVAQNDEKRRATFAAQTEPRTP
jgi:tetratricopeptide (TPR) repeat protein